MDSVTLPGVLDYDRWGKGADPLVACIQCSLLPYAGCMGAAGSKPWAMTFSHEGLNLEPRARRNPFSVMMLLSEDCISVTGKDISFKNKDLRQVLYNPDLP